MFWTFSTRAVTDACTPAVFVIVTVTTDLHGNTGKPLLWLTDILASRSMLLIQVSHHWRCLAEPCLQSGIDHSLA